MSKVRDATYHWGLTHKQDTGQTEQPHLINLHICIHWGHANRKKKTAKAVRVITVQVPAEKAVFLPGYTDQWGLEEPSCTTKTNNSVSLKWVTLELKQSGIPIAYILFYIPRTEWKCHVFAKQLKLQQLKNVSCGGPQPPEVSQAHNEVALM